MSSLQLVEAGRPLAGPGEALVRVTKVSLNPVDWKLCTGVAPWWEGAHIVGLDAAGVVQAVGEKVSPDWIGKRVAWHHNLGRQAGVFADFVTTPAHVLAEIPPGVSDEAAAALPCAGLTAYQALVRKCRIAKGDVALIQGASGGTGGFAVQIAKIEGAMVIAMARPQSFDRVKRLGADHVLDYASPELASQVREIAPDGVDVFFEVVKAQNVNENFRHIRFNGQFATTDPLPDLSGVDAYSYALSIHEIALGGAYGANDIRTQRDFPKMLSEMMVHVASGKLDPMITAEISFAEIPEYLQRLKDRKVEGKIIATVGETS